MTLLTWIDPPEVGDQFRFRHLSHYGKERSDCGAVLLDLATQEEQTTIPACPTCLTRLREAVAYETARGDGVAACPGCGGWMTLGGSCSTCARKVGAELRR